MSERYTDEWFAEQRALAAKATPGDWELEVDTCGACRSDGCEGEYNVIGPPIGCHAMFLKKPDAELVVAARNNYADLLERCQRAEKALRDAPHAADCASLRCREWRDEDDPAYVTRASMMLPCNCWNKEWA